MEAHYLAVCQGNITAAARELGIQRTYMFRLVREYGLHGSGRRDWGKKAFHARPGGFRPLPPPVPR